ncbi:pyridoxal-dependent decarboxylase, exosortase A system-associated [Rugamonas apoptosis]|uniref:Pyridoxal-dependent decarboxylase, exosortase A system-associated n=1 Tax=Rugamonas apoptosis TaxID=2758570 RepID=A0A7W2IK86_9BURK|nr:pyridoxal-dependent decarboxylase, exosortase A system-associated [Rugamonas apoptosis]MBA5687289.1 pyridoxal-dependent decarboxylase, exosortase A system-associated [Rugamonas apoptosis]
MSAPSHVLPQQLSVADGCLQLGGIGLPRLAERVGRTPFYAYDRGQIAQRVGTLRRVLPAGIRLHYAMKANPMPAVVQMLTGLVDGIDVASGGELRVALDTGMAPERVSFAGPGKTDGELRSAVAAGILLHLESEQELDRVAVAGEHVGVVPRVAIRINPDFELKLAGMKMGGGPRPFGVDEERVPAMLRTVRQRELDFQGFHIFCGAQNLSAAAIAEAQTLSVQLAVRMAEHAPAPLRQVNIGAGFGVPYFPGDQPLPLEPVANALQQSLDLLRAAAPDAALALELGRYLVAEAGVYVCRVLERKISHGHTYLITDGGLHHHLAASGNFGQRVRRNFPVAIGNRMAGEAREVVSVVGPLCTPLDVLAEQMPLAPAVAGDLVVVFQSGAYGLSASPAGFLSHPPALEVLV